jgi:hypothetical protein
VASVTYNLGIFPPMHNFLMDMKALNRAKPHPAPLWKTAPGPMDALADALAASVEQ